MANNNFTNFVTQFNKPKPTPTQPVAGNVQLGPIKPTVQGTQVTPARTTQPVSLAQQAVDKGYVSSVEEYNQAEARGKAMTQIPQTINSQTLQKGSDYDVPDLPTPPTSRVGSETPIKPQAPVETKPQTLGEQTKAYLQQELSGSGAIDTSKERESLMIDQKRKLSESLYNDMLTERERYDTQLEALEKNPEGKLSGNLNQEINKLTTDFNKNIAKKSIAYKIANDDYVGAEKTLSDLRADMKDQRDYKLSVAQASFDMIQDDLTESEKIALEQQNKLDYLRAEQEADDIETEGKETVAQSRGESIAESIKNGFTTIDKVSDDDLPYVYRALESQGYVDPTVASAITQSKERLANIDNLLQEGTGLAVGSGLRRTTGAIAGFIKSGRTQEAQGLIDNLIANTALEVLPALKGPASDKDIAFIKEAASQLKTNLTPESFEAKLKTFRGKITNGLVNSTAVPYEEKRLLLKDQFDLDNPDYSDEKITEMTQFRLNQLPEYMKPTSFKSAGKASTSTGNLPQRNNNPGNIKSGGLADKYAVGKDSQGHLIFPDSQTGFKAMQEDINAKISGNSRFLPANPTLAQLGKVYAEDPNWTNSVARILGVSTSTKTQSIPLSKLTQAIATQEGFYA